MAFLELISSPDAPLAESGNTAKPVVIFLHGYGSDERDLAGLGPYLPEGLPWISVRAPERHPAFGYAWFQLPSLERFSATDIGAATQALWDTLDGRIIPGSPLIPVGFSQGGLMASQLLRTRPEALAGAAILSGFVSAEAQVADQQLSETKPPVFWGRGTSDAVIPAHAIDATAAFLPGRSTLTERVYPGVGHSVSEQELADLHAFLTSLDLPGVTA